MIYSREEETSRMRSLRCRKYFELHTRVCVIIYGGSNRRVSRTAVLVIIFVSIAGRIDPVVIDLSIYRRAMVSLVSSIIINATMISGANSSLAFAVTVIGTRIEWCANTLLILSELETVICNSADERSIIHALWIIARTDNARQAAGRRRATRDRKNDGKEFATVFAQYLLLVRIHKANIINPF